MSVDYNRNPTGKGGFRPGVSGNPTGRKRGDLPPIDIKRLARAHTREAVAALVEITNDRKAKNSDRIVAANSLLDRGFGRPHTSIDVEMTLQKRINEMSLDELAAVEQLMTAAPPMLLEGTVEPVEDAPS
jgi:hypothetical protein